jgi:hypothetical protein
VLAAAGAAALAIVILGRGADEQNNPESPPSVAEVSPPTPVVAPPTQPDQIAVEEAVAPPEAAPSTDTRLQPMPVPEGSEAEIHGIDFGGKHGRISHTGTVTVLYVEEDETPPNSERSL